MASNGSTRRNDPLAMQIYSALLGGKPKVAKVAPAPQSRLKVEVRVETISSALCSPFHAPGFKETIERAAAGALTALGEASERLRRARAGIAKTRAAEPPASKTATPIVLVGPGAVRIADRLHPPREPVATPDRGQSAAA
jgi:hypothetical protein